MLRARMTDCSSLVLALAKGTGQFWRINSAWDGRVDGSFRSIGSMEALEALEALEAMEAYWKLSKHAGTWKPSMLLLRVFDEPNNQQPFPLRPPHYPTDSLLPVNYRQSDDIILSFTDRLHYPDPTF